MSSFYSITNTMVCILHHHVSRIKKFNMMSLGRAKFLGYIESYLSQYLLLLDQSEFGSCCLQILLCRAHRARFLPTWVNRVTCMHLAHSHSTHSSREYKSECATFLSCVHTRTWYERLVFCVYQLNGCHMLFVCAFLPQVVNI